MKLESVLHDNLGLNNKEASVYLACLSLKGETVMKIAQAAGVKRPTCYVILNELISRGLVFSEARGVKTIFRAVRPHALQNVLEQRLSAFRESLPLFESLYQDSAKPSIQILTDKDNVQITFAKIVNTNANKYFIGSVKDFSIYIPNFYNKYWLENKYFFSKQIFTRSSEIDPNLYNPQLSESMRIFEQKSLSLHIILIGNIIFLFTFIPDFSCTIIENQAFCRFFQLFFDMSWNQALPFVPRGTINNPI